MPSAGRFQSSRFELKYIITESYARAIRDFALSYLEPDPHADPARNCEYAVHSLYLDSRDLFLCRQTREGHKNRFKLRIRFYDDLPDSPAFLEIKRRENDVILKQRARVRRTAATRILNGHWPPAGDILTSAQDGLATVEDFCRLRSLLEASGTVFTSYMREAYVTPNDNTVRVTFDRRLYGTLYQGHGTLVRQGRVARPDVGGVILEIKFTDRFPAWLGHLARAFNLTRISMPKYVVCVTALSAPAPDIHHALAAAGE